VLHLRTLLHKQTFTASGMLDLLQEASVPEPLILKLCEHLLSRRLSGELQPAPGAADRSQSPDGMSGGAKVRGLQLHDLLVQYSSLRFAIMQRQLDEVQQQGLALQPHVPPCAQIAGGHGGVGGGKGREAGRQKGNEQTHAQGGSQPTRGNVLQRAAQFCHRRRRLLSAGLLLVCSALPLHRPARPRHRVAHACAALLAMHCTCPNS
jgi:hypothetical protein